MIVDILSVLPIQYIILWVDTDDNRHSSLKTWRAIKVLRLLRLAKVLRLTRLLGAFQRYDEIMGPTFTTFAILFVISILVHTLACVWFVLGANSEDGWIDTVYGFSEAFCGCHAGTYWNAFHRACEHTEGDKAPLKPCVGACPVSGDQWGCDDIKGHDINDLSLDFNMYMSSIYSAIQETNPTAWTGNDRAPPDMSIAEQVFR
eukprot:COSAG01_NODE_1176_length_11374_cov_476.847805_5_plen_203_part_00